ncbi:Arginine utilization regulatory protein RocR [Koleobacter methoxysyntrophicus]|uniref:Arginine utilization regulatory protein RocR n=1 Tax=Koleobacter methoxysyntrophicus TaxID=2751313 RepID=A0A8A0RK97_9FIRM|nr:sigma 54-interacting transcriptional regulator [Koleobacter methoxysyntrophicus]QSQ08060.1 Arginine utilization regulatory protein RocR [Koleobacter methoxysyntrophicus]
MKGITLITKGKNTCEALKKQLNDLLGDRVKIEGFYIDGNIKEGIFNDLVVISSNIIYEHAKQYLAHNCRVIIARRSINYHKIGKLLDIPPGTDALLVNDLTSTALETISLLEILGIDHINFFPYSPEIKDYPKLKLAVTPGELELVPDCVENVIDIKTRNIDFTTLVEILQELDLADKKANYLSARYLKDIIELIKETKKMADVNSRMNNQLQTIINTVHDGIIALDERKEISAFNPIAEGIFGVSRKELIGKKLNNVMVPKEVISVLENENIEKERFIKVNNRQVVINISPIKENNSVVGKVCTLKDVTEIQRLEEELRRKLRKQETYARYTFDDILGTSDLIKNTKELAKKISKSQSPILIQGESGTGKELFAQAIHNNSLRQRGPFVAVNFAALPESLLESELFGYDEGAFTGAKKGGMPGLFEQAHGGTIFLDEIGDAPQLFQVRLLRVLQEKQIRRIGGSKVIPIDVRVIAATNKDLKSLMKGGEFREDLYYRLNVLPLRIPPLRERRGDILDLAYAFYNDHFKRKPPMKASVFFGAISDHLLIYDWPGNIRELHNIVEYLCNVCPDKIPTPELLPGEFPGILKNGKAVYADLNRYKLEKNILIKIFESNKKGKPIGRRSISSELGLPEGKVRGIIEDMRTKGYIKVNRGKRGIEITEKGYGMINYYLPK